MYDGNEYSSSWNTGVNMEQFNVWFLLLDHSERVHKLKLSRDFKKKRKSRKDHNKLSKIYLL